MHNVLLVSNQILTRNALKKTIEKNENFFIKAEADTPKEAIDIIEERNINLIFSDFMMSTMSGNDFVKFVKKINKSIEVFLLAFPSDLFVRENENINLNQLILKPLTYEKVEEKLKLYENNYRNYSEYNFILEMKEKVNTNDFMSMYNYLADHIEKFDFNTKDTESKIYIRKSLINIAEELLSFNNITDYEKIIDENLQISNAIASDSRLCKNWIFKILEVLFQKKIITDYPILEDILRYIDNNIEKNISLSDVVKECNISQGYLSRLFKSEYNLTVCNFIHLKKINLAKEFIILENQNISDIAFNLGYNEYGYFSKVFKKYEKITVEQFRKAR